MPAGTVKFFNMTKGYGFITPTDGGEDLFVHINDLSGNPLKEGDEVNFDVNFDDRKGKTHAVNVSGGTGWPLSENYGKGDKGKGKGKWGGGGYDSWGY